MSHHTIISGFTQKPVTEYYVSGVFMDSGKPSEFAVHDFINPGIGAARRMAKAELIEILKNPAFSVYTWIWDYRIGKFARGRRVQLVGETINTVPADNDKRDLKHLINYSWLEK